VLVGEGEKPGMARLYPFWWIGEVPVFVFNLVDWATGRLGDWATGQLIDDGLID